MIDIIVDLVNPTNHHWFVSLDVELHILDVQKEIDLEINIYDSFERMHLFLSIVQYLIHLHRFFYDEYH